MGRRQVKSLSGEMLPDMQAGEQVMVDYKGKQFDARIVQKVETLERSTVKIKYEDKPFWINTETLDLKSPRLHLKEPGSALKAAVYPGAEGEVVFDVRPDIAL